MEAVPKNHVSMSVHDLDNRMTEQENANERANKSKGGMCVVFIWMYIDIM